MTHCVIWFKKNDGQEIHWEINLDYVPRQGELLVVEQDKNFEGGNRFLVDSVCLSLIFDGEKYMQIVDIDCKPLSPIANQPQE